MLVAAWLAALMLLLLAFEQGGALAASPRDVTVRKIWDAAPHNAFTDLIRFRDQWFLAFREGTAHASMDGRIRVLTSPDGHDWESAASLVSPLVDLRDPKFSITPEGTLMINAVAAQRNTSPSLHLSLYWTSIDGRTWASPNTIGDLNYWLWRVAWHGSVGYSVGYRTIAPYQTSLYSAFPEQGIDFTAMVSPLLSGAYVNETVLLFQPDEEALALTRRDPVGPYTTSLALLGNSHPPYTSWSWRETNLRLGGPDMLDLADGRTIVAARLYTPSLHTGLLWLDPEEATLTEFASLPSGGDNGYPGLVYDDRVLWVSYYSSHEGKASIYIASVQLPLNSAHSVFLPFVQR